MLLRRRRLHYRRRECLPAGPCRSRCCRDSDGGLGELLDDRRPGRQRWLGSSGGSSSFERLEVAAVPGVWSITLRKEGAKWEWVV